MKWQLIKIYTEWRPNNWCILYSIFVYMLKNELNELHFENYIYLLVTFVNNSFWSSDLIGQFEQERYALLHMWDKWWRMDCFISDIFCSTPHLQQVFFSLYYSILPCTSPYNKGLHVSHAVDKFLWLKWWYADITSYSLLPNWCLGISVHWLETFGQLVLKQETYKKALRHSMETLSAASPTIWWLIDDKSCKMRQNVEFSWGCFKQTYLK